MKSIHSRGTVIAALHAHGGNVAHASAALGLSPQALRLRIKADPVISRALVVARRRAKKVQPCPLCSGEGMVAAP